ncbi:hypothetical protein CTI12_AA202340 [Artemisia annua]|uniref:Uncharacterized protein n=1 Tax=Artemisia annua TaxID=35608 RepID=A0A2U1P2G5_ARTAN|nr:hypothetical protein CTI12_AA202340 [Artemisia annua]
MSQQNANNILPSSSSSGKKPRPNKTDVIPTGWTKAEELNFLTANIDRMRRRENEDLIRYIGQKCANLEANIERREQLIQEGECFGPFHDVAPDAVECMGETQQREQDILAALMGVLDLAREGRTEKERHVGLMDLKG